MLLTLFLDYNIKEANILAEFVNIKTNIVDKNVPTKKTFEESLPLSQKITLTASNWDSNNKTQTVTVDGVLVDEGAQEIIVTPIISNAIEYYASQVHAISQAIDSLTFSCDTIPSEDIDVYVVITPVKKDY